MSATCTVEPVRLNREGRPWGVPREHVNRHGVEKPALQRGEAIAKALDYDRERQADPARRGRGPVDAYECSYCGAWHVGTLRPGKRKAIERVEVGDRAWWNLLAENQGPTETRLQMLGMRLRRRDREARSSRAA